MTRPMTGQPNTDEELTNATQRANKSMNDDIPEDIKNHPLTKDSLKDDASDDKSLEELREFRETVREEGNDELGVYGEPQTDDEKEMIVTDGDKEVQRFTREEWDKRRDTRMQTWDRLERNGGKFVRVARWFNDSDVNKVKTGRGFYGTLVEETEKALAFEVTAEGGNHNASTEMVWIPKKAVQVYELSE